MDQPSTSDSNLSTDEFLSLPWLIKREILSNLSPWDLIRFADSHPQFERLVLNQPKKFHLLNQPSNLEIDQKGSRQYYSMDFYEFKNEHHQKHTIKESENEFHYVEFYKGDYEEAVKKWRTKAYKLLLSNCSLQQVSSPTEEMINWSFEVKELHEVTIKDVSIIEKMIEKLNSSSLELEETVTRCEQIEDGWVIDVDLFTQIITSPKIRSLECFSIWCPPMCLHNFIELKIPKMMIRFPERDDFSGFCLSFMEQVIKQWENDEREIDMIVLRVPFESDDGEDENENIRNFEINEMAHQLAFGRLGTFEDRTIDRRFKLIQRASDGEGLLIVTGALTMALIRCDYKIRRKRGLGSMKADEEFMERVILHFRNLKTLRKNMDESRKRGPELESAIEDVDQSMFTMFGIEPTEVIEEIDEIDEEKEREEKWKQDIERMEISYKNQELNLLQALKNIIDYRKGIPRRELAIDQLWDEKATKINLNLIHEINTGFYLNSYPSILVHSRSETCTDEFVAEYIRIGKIPNLDDFKWI